MTDARLSTGTVDEFFERGRHRAAKLDRGEKLTPEVRITFEDPADLVRALSAERVRLLQVLQAGAGESEKYTLSRLAHRLKRDRASVNRDVAVLRRYDLLRTRSEANPGHGRVAVVEPLAKKYHLAATI